MRLITRADFDGIVCGVLITSREAIDRILFVEPKPMQDGEVEVTCEDIIANLPFHPHCHLWFDHHFTNQVSCPFRGRFRLAPSAARVVFEYYSERLKRFQRFNPLKQYEEMVNEADRIDSGNLTMSDILRPERYVLLSFTLDPAIKTDELYWATLIHLLRDQPFASVMENPEVKERCEQVVNDFTVYHTLVVENSRQDGNVVITDFRGSGFKGRGNRFLVYSLFPETDVAVKIFPDVYHQGQTGISVGKNIFNRTSSVNVGELLSRYGGGGHQGAGSCRVPDEDADGVVREIVKALRAGGG